MPTTYEKASHRFYELKKDIMGFDLPSSWDDLWAKAICEQIDEIKKDISKHLLQNQGKDKS